MINQLSELAYEEKLMRVLSQLPAHLPHIDRSFDAKTYAKAIFQPLADLKIGFEEHQAFLALILSIIAKESGFRRRPPQLLTVPFVRKWSFSRCLGPMRIAITDALNRKRVDSVEGGIRLGIEHLLTLTTAHDPHFSEIEAHIPFIGVDWMAGPYTCRNAAFQRRMNILIRELGLSIPTLTEDGGLITYRYMAQRLRYDAFGRAFLANDLQGRNPKKVTSKSEQALYAISSAMGWNLDLTSIRSDFLKSRDAAFEATTSYALVKGEDIIRRVVPEHCYERMFSRVVPHPLMKKHLGPIFSILTGLSFDVRHYAFSLQQKYEIIMRLFQRDFKHDAKA